MVNALVLEFQEQNNWCWAACARMGALVFGKGATRQCEIVNQSLNIQTCCADGSSAACDRTLEDKAVPALYTSFGLAADTMGMDEASIRVALSNSNLVLMLLNLQVAYHYALLYGTDGPEFLVADPKYGKFTANYNQLATGYGKGSLATTWTIHPVA
ncbi:MAG: hypothetical protein NVS2B17_31500 [Candidatus Velthaea sp.]